VSVCIYIDTLTLTYTQIHSDKHKTFTYSVFECMWVLWVYLSVLEYIRVYSSVFECMLVMYSRSVLSGSVSTWSSNVWKSILSLWEWAQERDFRSSSSLCWWQSFSRTCSWNTLKYTHNIHMQSNTIKYTHHTHKHSNTLLTLNTLKTFTYTHIHSYTLT